MFSPFPSPQQSKDLVLNFAPPENAPVVLLVEDDVLIRHVAAEFLREEGCHVVEAATATEALILLQSRTLRIALLVTDVVMPGDMNGFELADWTRENCSHVGILILSGYYKPGSHEDRYEIIRKPYVYEYLGRRVRALLTKRRIR